MADVLIVGSGLIGASIGLALRGGADVVLHDRDVATAAQAIARGAGRLWDGVERAQTVVVAVPPSRIASALLGLQGSNIGRTYTHVASVQSQVQREVEMLGCDVSTIVGGHPLAGRETSGPQGASADLFIGRTWAICPSSASSAQALADVRDMAEACGATVVELAALVHDASVALLSHLPQVAASALAGLLAPTVAGHAQAGATRGVASQAAISSAEHGLGLTLSGQGLVDTTRLAASDPTLWAEILVLNAAEVAPAVRRLADSLGALADDLEGGEPHRDRFAAVLEFLLRGNRGRALVPVKRGEVSEAFGRVRVSVDDQPGRLAGLLTAAGDAGCNVEDVHVEHVPGRPQGLIELVVETSVVGDLGDALRAAGWHVMGELSPTHPPAGR